MGRPRKAGKRTKSGRLSRARVNFDRGTERAQAMQALYGPDGCDAIGRAYQAGLLGQGNEAKALLDMARKVSRLYWRAYETGAVRSCIADRSFGSVVDLDYARIKEQETWLADSLRIVDRMGRNVRRAFDQLVIDVNPDCGPDWLDRMAAAAQYAKEETRHKKKLVQPEYAESDMGKLREALDGLEALF